MPKLIKNTTAYTLTGSWTNSLGQTYAAQDSLYAWYQFDVLPTGSYSQRNSSYTALDLSGNSRYVLQTTASMIPRVRRDQAPATLTRMKNFPRGSSYFNDDVLVRNDSGSDFSFGDGTTDSPFSVSAWVRAAGQPGGAAGVIMAKFDPAATQAVEWVFYFEADGGPHVRLGFACCDADIYDGSMGLMDRFLSGWLPLDEWHHVVATYDGNKASGGITLYVNGEQWTSIGSDNGYHGMHNTAARFTIGSDASHQLEFVGDILEAVVWSTELSSEDVRALYSAKGIYTSGYLNNPSRILLRESDFQTGSYPTVARTGDPDFLGKGSVAFDDTQTIEFGSSYARGFIQFTKKPRAKDRIALTGSILGGGQKRKRFIFTDVANPTREPKKIGDATLGLIPAYDSSRDVFVYVDGENASPISIAAKFAKHVNSCSMGLEATTFKSTVHLRAHLPMTGTYAQGNVIIAFSANPSPSSLIPVVLEQFKQHGPRNYQYPFIIPRGWPSSGSSIPVRRVATPNATGTLEGPAIMRAGVSDAGLSAVLTDPGERLSPFDESRIYIDPSEAFYSTGTLPTVLPGFDQRLSSKTSFTVNLTPKATTKVYFSTGAAAPGSGPYGTSALGLAAGINSGLAYFNFADKQWEVIGDLTTGSNVDYLSAFTEGVTGSYLAVVPGKAGSIAYDSTGTKIKNAVMNDSGWATGLPMQYAGFPVASKFDATDSQLLDMSKYITSPFLLEKVVLEISGAFGTPPTGRPYVPNNTNLINPSTNPITFMLLNQFQTELARTSSLAHAHLGGPPGGPVFFETPRTEVDWGPDPIDEIREALSIFPCSKNKDVIWYGRYSSFVSAPNQDSDGNYLGGWADIVQLKADAPAFYKAADVWKPVQLGTLPTARIFNIDRTTATYTGSIAFKAPPRAVAFCPRSSPPWYHRHGGLLGRTRNAENNNVPLFGVNAGARNLFSLSSGRSYIGGAVGGKLIGEVFPSIDLASGPYGLPLYEFAERVSPYILQPTDKLVLAIANQRYPTPNDQDIAGVYDRLRPFTNEAPRSSQYVVAYPGGGTRVPPSGSGVFMGPEVWSMTFTPGCTARITFFGTQLREAKPVSSGLNQPLTSDAIHEDVRDDISPYGEALCLDQFDVEPETSFRGGYLDNIVSGSMYGNRYWAQTPSAAVNRGTANADALAKTPANVRMIQASVVDGQAGITGSLQRFVRLTNSDETYYDSTVPNLAAIVEEVGIYRIDDGDAFGQIALIFAAGRTGEEFKGSPFSFPLDDTAMSGSARWGQSAAFELITDLPRQSNIGSIYKDPESGKPAVETVAFVTTSSLDQGGKGNLPDRILQYIGSNTPQHSTLTLGGPSTVLKQFFGFGDFQGIPIKTGPIENDGQNSTYPKSSQLLRGFKYGLLNAVPVSPNAVFRYDTFGQFRDMLEPRPFARFFETVYDAEGTAGDRLLGDEPPVQVVFMGRDGDVDVRPKTTNSQNLSTFATSSIPFFDLVGEYYTKEGVLVTPRTSAGVVLTREAYGRDRRTPQPDMDPSSRLSITIG